MDKFDQSIKQAKQTHEPNSNFVEVTMKQITSKQPRKLWSVQLWAPALAGGLAVIALIFTALPIGSHNTATKTVVGSKSGSASQTSTSKSVATPAPGNDDASLASDLSGINGAVNQENNDQNDTNAAFNDSSQQIVVPTD